MDKLQQLSAPIGRLFLSLIFIVSGMGKISGYVGTQAGMESVGVPGMLLPVVIVLEVLGGIAIVLGFKARPIAFLLAGFSVLSALLFHNFLADPSQMNAFMKNVAMAGGFLMIFAHGAGAYSLDNHLDNHDASSRLAR